MGTDLTMYMVLSGTGISTGDKILLETGDHILLETGDKVLKEA